MDLPITDAALAEHQAARQRKRKCVEAIFGGLKRVGGITKTRVIGQAPSRIAACRLPAAAYALLRIERLQAGTRKRVKTHFSAHPLGIKTGLKVQSRE